MVNWTEYFEWNWATTTCMNQPYSKATFGFPVGTTASGNVTAQVGSAYNSKSCNTTSKVEVTSTGSIQTNAIGNTVRGRITSSGLCLDARGGASDGTAAILYGCHDGDNQSWVLASDSTLQLAFGYCLDTSSVSSRLVAVVKKCGSSASQKWTLSGTMIVNTASGQCLTWSGASASQDSQLQLSPCRSNANQKWTVPEKPI
jgi:hypothetical protein